MTWKVESITEADIEDLHELFSNAGPYVSARTLSDYWLYARLFSSSCLCIRGDTGKPIAALVAFRDQTKDRDEMYIQDVAVSPAKRKRGFAKALMTDLERTARKYSIRRIWLTSEIGNIAAARLWRALGYRNETGDYLESGLWVSKDLKGAGRDRVVYELSLEDQASE